MTTFDASSFWAGFEDFARSDAVFGAAEFKTPVHANAAYLSISAVLEKPFDLVAAVTTSKSLPTAPDNTSLRAEVKTNTATGRLAVEQLAAQNATLLTNSGACAWPHIGKSDAKIELRWIGANLHSTALRMAHYGWLVAAFKELRDSFQPQLMQQIQATG